MITALSRASLPWVKRAVSGVARRERFRTQERPRPNRRPLYFELLEDRLVLDGGSLVQSPLSVADAFRIGVEAYEYAYPIVLLGQTQLVATNVATANTNRAPLNQFTYGTLAGPNETDVVGPNVNVLYNNAFLNLQPEPMVLHIPNTNGRYFIQEILDAWTNVDYDPSMRIGTPPGDYLLTGPNWSGTVPAGITQVFAMPTNMAWILGRTFTTGQPDDVATASTIQHEFTLTPLSAYGTAYTPPTNLINLAIDTVTPPINQVANMGAGTFFGMLAALWITNPPQSVDSQSVDGGPSILSDLHQVGLVPGQPYDLSQQPRAIQLGMEAAAPAALRYISSDLALTQVRHQQGGPENAWTLTNGFDGQWGQKYFHRAVTAWRGIGINEEADAVYAYTLRDSTGQLLNSSNSYTITFPTDNLPPVKTPYGQNGYWSVTVYNAAGFLGGESPNVIGSTQISAGTWTPNSDGSYTIVIQQDQPADTSNWINPPPADSSSPDGNFILMVRMYSPLPQVYDPNAQGYPYKLPAIQRVSNTANANPASQYVQQLYRDVLGREADSGGLRGWTSLLEAGASRATVAAGIWNSPEHRGIEVDGYYQTYLQRAADPAGRIGWINALLAGMSETAVARAFLTSPEYTSAYPDSAAVVVGYYADLLGRLPDETGFTGWQQAAAGGASSAQLAESFLTSEEANRNLVERYYQLYLGRQPDPSEEAGWLAGLHTASNTSAAVGQAILASDEYFARSVESYTSRGQE